MYRKPIGSQLLALSYDVACCYSWHGMPAVPAYINAGY